MTIIRLHKTGSLAVLIIKREADPAIPDDIKTRDLELAGFQTIRSVIS